MSVGSAIGNVVVGPAGATGATGSVGNSGATGGVGNTGYSGSTGSVGNQGNSGATGATGATGPASVVTGNSGATGPTGAQGAVGNSGATGTGGGAGNPGPTGSTGTPGTYTMNTSRLLGRTTAGSGAPEEISVGGGITLSGLVLGLGAITPSSVASTGAVSGTGFASQAVDAYGYGLWASPSFTYGMNMSAATNATYGGRVAGETTSDYNTYFNMAVGTNRGWVFKSGSSVVAGIDGAGNIRAVGNLSGANFSGSHSGTSSGTNTGDQTNISGNAATATTATTANNANAANNTAAATYYPIFATSQGASVAMGTNSGYTFNPSTGALTSTKVYNAIYNDIADYLELDEELESIEYGRVYVRTKTGETRLSNAIAEKGIIGVTTDTYGYGLGKKHIGNKELPICVGGFTLAFCDQDYEPGTALTCGPNGILVEMPLKLKRSYPERLIATYYKTPTTSEWNGILVNGRKLVKVI